VLAELVPKWVVGVVPALGKVNDELFVFADADAAFQVHACRA
jgi:hypothetical protein